VLISPQIRDTVDFDTAACSPRASVSAASTSRVDSPRTNPAITSDSSALVLVTCLPNSCEANSSVVPRSLGRASVTGPAVVLTVVGPVAHPRMRVPTGRGPLIAVPPQECGHLGLNRALQQQLRAQLGDPLNRARQILAAGEHLIDLRAQPLGGRYSLRHGRRLLPQT